MADNGHLGGGTSKAPHTPSHTQRNRTPRGAFIGPKIVKDMNKRRWTISEIDDAIKHGNRIDAVNMANGADTTRYINPKTNKSVVIENNTGKIIHVGDERFSYSVESGEKPGAVIRPAPSQQPKPAEGRGGRGGALGGNLGRLHPPLFPWELLD